MPLVWPLRLICILLLPVSSQSFSADSVKLPPINLGTTAFRDGMAGPGTLLQITSNNSQADSFRSASGDALPGDNEIQVNSLVLQLAYITRYQLWGGFYGAEILLPYANIDPDTSLPGLPKQREQGVGDLLVSPFMIQWVRDSLFGKTYFHRLNFIFSLPTGQYDSGNQVNPGSNLIKFNPYYAGTIELNPALSASFRFHYLWNSRNTEPVSSMNAASIQPGTALHFNYALSYLVAPRLRLGLAGYYLRQLTEDRIDGVRQVDSRETVVAIGPGLHYRTNNGFFNFNSYFEFDAKNRTEGSRVLLRYAWLFK